MPEPKKVPLQYQGAASRPAKPEVGQSPDPDFGKIARRNVYETVRMGVISVVMLAAIGFIFAGIVAIDHYQGIDELSGCVKLVIGILLVMWITMIRRSKSRD